MKKLYMLFSLSLMFVVLSCSSDSSKVNKTEQIQDKAIVVLTYDDGIDSQLNYAIPQLDEKGFKGTFFLYGTNLRKDRLDAWSKVGKNGHELGNHSVYHPCTAKDETDSSGISFALQNYSLGNILSEVKIMDNMLTLLDGKENHYSYAYPCGEYMTFDCDNYGEELINTGLIKYCRAATRDEIIENIDSLDNSRIPTILVKDDVISVDSLIEKLECVKQKKAVAILLFHGVGGDYLTFGAQNHKKLLDYLADNSDKIEVLTFSDALEKIEKNKKTSH